MLGVMRKYKQSVIIKVVFGIIVFSFIGTIFLVWGKGDSGLKGSSGYAIKVDRTKISYEDYQQAYLRIRSLFQQMLGSVTPEMEKQYNMKKTATDNLINQVLIKREAKKMGLSVSKEEVVKAISQVSAFQKDGVFNFDQYQQLLKSQRMTPAAFEQAQEEELLIKKAQDKIKGDVKVTDEDLLKQFKLDNDKVELSYVSFSPAEMVKEVKLTDQELQSYLQSHQEEFRTQEQVSVSYLIVEPAAYAPKVTVTEDETNGYYQKHIDKYQGKGGILPYAQVKEQVRKDTITNKSGQLAYEKAAEAVNKFGKTGDLAAAAQLLGVKSAETALFSLKTPPQAIAGEQQVINRAFLLKANELGDPVETSRGIFLLKLKERKPSTVPPLADVRKLVEELARKDKAKELAKKKAEEALVQLAKGSGAYKLQETGLFLNKETSVPKIGPARDLVDAAFKLTTAAAAAATPFAVNGIWYAVKLKSRAEAPKDEFAKQKEAIRTKLLPKKQEEAMSSWLKGLRDKATIVINPALMAE
jgi:peptidyl-prolyl cis-trans isomerase D